MNSLHMIWDMWDDGIERGGVSRLVGVVIKNRMKLAVKSLKLQFAQKDVSKSKPHLSRNFINWIIVQSI